MCSKIRTDQRTNFNNPENAIVIRILKDQKTSNQIRT